MHNDIVSKLGFSDAFRDMYFVDDLKVNDCKVLFILESPHKDEIVAKHPVAGSSGKAMAKILSNSDILDKKYKNISFGNIAQNHESDFGILNVCQIPLQPSAYCCHYLEKILSDGDMLNLYSAFVLRSTEKCLNREFCSDTRCNKIKKIILSDFERRLKNVGKETHLVACGKFADNYFGLLEQKVLQRFKDRCIRVPHPSYGNWSRERYAGIINEMIAIIKEKQEGVV
jgi:hypothetical protein